MIVVAGTVRFPPENLAAARSPMDAMLAASRAEAGCRVYSYAIDVQDPGLVRVFEVWESREALTAHFGAPHMAVWRQAIGTLGVRDRDLKLYEVSAAETL